MRIIPNQQDIVTLALGIIVIAAVVHFHPAVISFLFPLV